MPARPSLPADWREALIALAAVETGLLEAFADASEPAAAARAAGLDPRAVRLVATALADLGYLSADGDGTLALTPRGAALLGPGDDGTDVAGGLHLEARAMRSHLALPDALRTGRPVDDVSAGDPETVDRFARAMRHIAAPRAPVTVAAAGPPPPGGRLLDVGGAPGTYARAFAAAGWEVTVLDLPGPLDVAGEGLPAAGVRVVAGDAAAALPDGPWDAVYLGNLVHLFDPDAAGALVARAGAALRPGGLLAVQEVLGDASPQGPGFGVMMLVSTPGGEAYTEADYRRWMAAAACPVERVVALEEGWHHLLLGRRG
ncbi:MAG TPA: class I SAM-dependent methyltransferase [Miltoncostaeaceae bacterium]|nr:class I SAM-dependent methyltransferase [Miltoncostaeaceae bacterium]